MSFDIFGQPLKRGHCEVHPHVNEEWPCSLCLMESEQRRRTESNDNAQHDMILEVEHLKMQRDELLAALQGMIDIANDSQGVAGYHLNGEVADWGEFEEWQAACDAISKINGGAENHSPDIAKMVVQDGWQLVPVEPTIEMVQAATHSAVGFGTRAAYQAMLAAAPKHEGVSS